MTIRSKACFTMGVAMFLGMFLVANATHAVSIGTDNASATVNAPAYTDGWQTGDDGYITGDAAFGAWFLASDGKGSFAGVTIEDSTDGGSDLNTGGVAFGLYADNNGQGTYSDAYRWFDADLGVGQTFSLDMKVNFRSGWKGIVLRDSSDVEIFKFTVGNVGAGDDYTVEIAASGAGSIGNSYASDTIFHLAFTQTSAAGGAWAITRSGGVADLDTGTYSGVVQNFKLFASEVGGGSYNNLWVNNLQIIPEPASAGLLGLGLLGLLGVLRRSI